MEPEEKEIDLSGILHLRANIKAKMVPGLSLLEADSLKLSPENHRSSYLGRDAIMASLMENGYLAAYPIEVDLNTMTVMSGNTRVLAAQALPPEWRANNPLVAICYQDLTPQERAVLIVEGNELRFSLSYSDTCLQILWLKEEMGFSVRAIENMKERNKVSKSTVQNLYTVAKNCPLEVLKAVDNGMIKKSVALKLSREDEYGNPFYSKEEQGGIVQDPHILGLTEKEFTRFLKVHLKTRDAQKAEVNRITPPFESMAHGTTNKTDDPSPEVQRRRYEEAGRLADRIAFKRVKGWGRGGIGAFTEKEACDIRAKGLKAAALKEYLVSIREIEDEILLKVEAMEAREIEGNSVDDTTVTLTGEEKGLNRNLSEPEADTAAEAAQADPTPVFVVRAQGRVDVAAEQNEDVGFISPSSLPAKKFADPAL